MARFVAKQNMGLKEFEFSQNYAMYYDKLERVIRQAAGAARR